MSLAVRAQGLSKRYSAWPARRSVDALHGVDLNIPRGSCFGLIGPNGAGKTTLLKIMLGLIEPSAGAVSVLDGAPGDVAVRRRIGYLPERLQLPAAWRARDFLKSVARLKRVEDASREVDRQLERVGLWEGRDGKTGGFSKGMKQRLGLAAALLGGPELLVLDEPTDGIDPQGRVEFRRILREERARGATVFLNSHLLSETERICDVVGILLRGRIVRSGGLSALCGAPEKWSARFLVDRALDGLSECGFEPTDVSGAFVCNAPDPGELNVRLDAARRRGAVLLELTPMARSLEDILLGLIGAGDARAP